MLVNFRIRLGGYTMLIANDTLHLIELTFNSFKLDLFQMHLEYCIDKFLFRNQKLILIVSRQMTGHV